jgi:hypothetical protein
VIIRKHIAASLVLLIIFAQGLALWHGVDHLSLADIGDCVLCLKAEQQKHALVDAIVGFDPGIVFLQRKSSVLASYKKQTGKQFHSRAPPVFS